jgi:hypothetical protein
VQSVITFRLLDAAPVAFSVAPLVALTVEATNADASRAVQSGLLRCQVQIDAASRAYDAEEAARLRGLFGEGAVWGRAVRRLLWAQVTAVLPQFTDRCEFEIHAPCTSDVNVVSAHYCQALRDTDVPVSILFSGTVFSKVADGGLEARPLPWSSEARFAMPSRVWRDAIERQSAGTQVLLRREIHERLARYGEQGGFATLDEAVESLLSAQNRSRS